MQHIIDKEEALVEQNTSYREHRMISDQYKILATKFYNKISHRLSKFDGNFLEIGTFNGMGTSNLAKEFPEKQFYVIDPFIEDGNTGYIVNSSLTS